MPDLGAPTTQRSTQRRARPTSPLPAGHAYYFPARWFGRVWWDLRARRSAGAATRLAAAAAGPTLVVVGAVVLAAVVLVQTTVLNEATYTRSLDSADVYRRAYTDVLADPELVSLQEQLIGRYAPVSAAEAPEVRAATSEALRLALPPSRMQAGTEVTVGQVVAYLRGDTPRLEGEVGMTELVDRFDHDTTAALRAALADTAESVAVTVEAYEADVAWFVDQLAAGRVPDEVPIYGGASFDPGEIVAVLLERFGDYLDGPTRKRIEAAVHHQDERDALVAAGSALVASQARVVAAQLRDPDTDTADLAMVRAVSTRTRPVAPSAVDELNRVRGAAGWLSWPTGIIGLVTMGAGAAVIAARFRRRPALGLTVLGASGVGGGLAIVVSWFGFGRPILWSPLASMTSTGAGAAGLPSTARTIMTDVARGVGNQLDHAVIDQSLILAALGLGLVVAANARRLLHRPLQGVGCAGLLVVVSVGGPVPTATVGASTGERVCNGHVELCDRPYDQVVYAATHNSMASSDVVRVWPDQDLDLRSQLDSGIRALLIDTHYFTPLVSLAAGSAGDASASLPTPLRRAIGPFTESRPGTYLCHLTCAIGARPLVEGLGDIRQFLDDSPGAVVTLIIQDAISVPDNSDAFTRAGLDPYLFTHRAGEAWPTLGSMVDEGRRLVVFAQHSSGPPAWYHPAFDLMQETPFEVHSPDQLSCDPGRGDPGAALFLMNHWVQRGVPDRAVAAAINEPGVIIERALRCQRERGRMPNFIAVDFSGRGDVVAAVDSLNRQLNQEPG